MLQQSAHQAWARNTQLPVGQTYLPSGDPNHMLGNIRCQVLTLHPDSPPNIVGVAFVVLTGVFSVDSVVTYGQIVLKIDLGRCLCGYIQRTRADSGCCQAEEGMARPGNSAESPSTAALRRTAYAGYGSAAIANILCRALSSNSYEGWPRARRIISLLA